MAPFYERHWGTAFFDSACDLFLVSLQSRVREDAQILDLCCGTGDFAQWLDARGLRVTGVDNSAPFLASARAKLPSVDFYEADMGSFRLQRRFDAITCFYNSINQALTAASLRAVLHTVREHLAPGGYFLFDVIEEQGYLEFWESEDVVEHEGRHCELHYRYDRIAQLATCQAAIRENGTEPLVEFTLYQRPIRRQEIREELRRAGFLVDSIRAVRKDVPRRGRLAVLARVAQ
nr:class I SAM-dependent methyltransferase [Bryobacter aggregatus]